MHRQVQPHICGRYDALVYCVESVERVPRNLEIPKTPGAPASRRVSTLATGNEFLTRPAAGVVEVEDTFQIDSRDDRQIQVYCGLSCGQTRSPFLEAERLYRATTISSNRRRIQLH